jgi:hypothetical protein
MNLSPIIDSYVAHERSLGMRFDSPLKILKAFNRAISSLDAERIDQEAVLAFLNRSKVSSSIVLEEVTTRLPSLRPWSRTSSFDSPRTSRSGVRSRSPPNGMCRRYRVQCRDGRLTSGRGREPVGVTGAARRPQGVASRELRHPPCRVARGSPAARSGERINRPVVTILSACHTTGLPCAGHCA